MIAACQQAVRAQMQNRCVVCGPDNPRGLRISYARQEDGAVTADWCPSEDWEGFQGIVHGGIISTVLDEAMSKAVAAASCEALTGELKVRFRRLVASREPLHIRGWITARATRLVQAEASLTAADGSERAHAWASFVVLRRKRD